MRAWRLETQHFAWYLMVAGRPYYLFSFHFHPLFHQREVNVQRQQEQEGNPYIVMYLESHILGEQSEGYGFDSPELGDAKARNKVEGYCHYQ